MFYCAGEGSVVSFSAFWVTVLALGATVLTAWGGYGKNSQVGLSLKRVGPLPAVKVCTAADHFIILAVTLKSHMWCIVLHHGFCIKLYHMFSSSCLVYYFTYFCLFSGCFQVCNPPPLPNESGLFHRNFCLSISASSPTVISVMYQMLYKNFFTSSFIL